MLSVFFASTGRHAYYVCAIWILADAGNSAGPIALFLALGSISEFLASVPAGYLVDRFDRRRLCVASDAIRILILITTSAALLRYEIDYVLYASAIFFAAADRLYLTASSAMVASVAVPERLVAFNSLTYVAMQAGNMLAAIATGWLLSAASQTVCFLFVAGTFAISMLSMSKAKPRLRSTSFDQCHPPEAPPETSEGTGIAGVPPNLIVSYVLIYAMGILVSALISNFVLQELQGTSFEFGMLEFYWAAGAIASMLILTLKRLRRVDGRAIPIIVFASGLALAFFYATRNLDIAFALMAILGAGYNLSRVLIDVEIQRLVSSAELGRTKGWIHATCMGFSLTVYGALAIVGDELRPSAAFLIFGSGMIGCVVTGHILSFVKSRTSTTGGMPS